MFSRAVLLLIAISLLATALAGVAAAEGAYVEATGSVNVRRGAGLGYSSLGTVEKGTRLTYLNSSTVDDRGVIWYLVSYEGVTGWVSSRYTTLK